MKKMKEKVLKQKRRLVELEEFKVDVERERKAREQAQKERALMESQVNATQYIQFGAKGIN